MLRSMAYDDSHFNDAFDGVAAWAWSDNSMIKNKTNNILNLMVTTAKIKNGKLKVKKPIQLTNLKQPGFIVMGYRYCNK